MNYYKHYAVTITLKGIASTLLLRSSDMGWELYHGKGEWSSCPPVIANQKCALKEINMNQANFYKAIL